MAVCSLIICEKTNHWAVALRWALLAQPVRVYETRTWNHAWQALQDEQSSLVAIELRRGQLEEVLRQLRQITIRSARTGAIVLTERSMAEHEWLLREAGALHVAVSTRNLAPLARLVGRFCRRERSARKLIEHDQDADSFAIRAVVWQRLPWSD
jgi:DNA-binding response OmpR family regulator